MQGSSKQVIGHVVQFSSTHLESGRGCLIQTLEAVLSSKGEILQAGFASSLPSHHPLVVWALSLRLRT